MKRYLPILVFIGTGFLALALKAQSPQDLCPQLPPPIECKKGGEFLCVNTPPGGVDKNFIILQGRLNLQNTSLGSFSLSKQHDYTKKLESLQLSEPITSDCWNAALTPQQNFCLEEGGAFAVYVPLEELGPYSIFISASRMQGSAMQETVRTSYVIAPTVTEDVVKYETKPNYFQATLDLLAGCGEAKDFCDFLGASTGGVVVTAENIVGDNIKTIRCETNRTQGGVGRFVITVPLEAAKNRVKLFVCNAATGFDRAHCPMLTPPEMQAGEDSFKIEVLSPSPVSPNLWDAQSYPTLPLQFKIKGFQPNVCDDSVTVTLNRGDPKPLCANLQGIYSAPIRPSLGYNIVTISLTQSQKSLTKTIFFGWGTPLTDRRLPEAVRFFISKKWMDGQIELFETKITSLIEKLFSGSSDSSKKKSSSDSRTSDALKNTLGYCPNGGSNSLKIKMVAPPKIKELKIDPIGLQNDRVELVIRAKDVRFSVQLTKGDLEPLPLTFSFASLTLHPILVPYDFEGKKLWKAMAPYTDCTYKREGACLKMPALLSPKSFEGNANKAGSFVVCDADKNYSENMQHICRAFNKVDRQTRGALQEKILDTLNSLYACSGSAALGKMFLEGVDVKKGNVAIDEIVAKSDGIGISLATLFGNEAAKGILANPQKAPLSFWSRPTDGISLDLNPALVSQLSLGLKEIAVDDEFFKKKGIDFEKLCDAPPSEEEQPIVEEKPLEGCAVNQTPKKKEEKPAICNIRPRVQEILGSSGSSIPFLKASDPVKLILKPSLLFPLRIQVLDAQGTVAIEFADWELTIEAKDQPIISTSLSLKLVANISEPEPSCEKDFPYKIRVKPLSQRSQLWLIAKEESNKTIVPGGLLISDLKDKMRAFLFSAGQEFPISLPRFFEFKDDSLMKGLGFEELTWGENGFELGWDSQDNRLLLDLLPILKLNTDT